jgi:hypothetical protein
MTVQYVRKTLDDENELLTHLISEIRGYDVSGFTGSAKYIARSWIRFLDERRDTNRELIAQDRDEIRRDLNEERTQIEAYIDHTDELSRPYREQWRKFLNCEKDILDKLIDKM